MKKHNQQNKKRDLSNPTEENPTPGRAEMSPRQECEPLIEFIDLIRGGMHQVFEY
jgi:hypothetical protein